MVPSQRYNRPPLVAENKQLAERIEELHTTLATPHRPACRGRSFPSLRAA